MLVFRYILLIIVFYCFVKVSGVSKIFIFFFGDLGLLGFD